MKIKVFQVRNPAGEETVNQWLKEHDKDVQIVNMFTNAVASDSGSAMVLITYIYRELVTPAKDGQPAVFE